MAREWISLHVFYHGDLDSLLAGGVSPLVGELSEGGSASLFFFVRYWSGGPHIRLRVLPAEGVESPALAEHLRRRLEASLASLPRCAGDGEAYRKQAEFMREFRSRFNGEWGIGKAHLDVDEPFQERDMVQLRGYEFDLARYGGEHARPLAEEHFSRSSELALSIVRGTLGERGKRHAWALLLMAAVAPALGLSADAASRLFRKYFSVSGFIFGLGEEEFGEKMGFRSFDSQLGDVTGIIRQAGAAREAEPGGRVVARWRNHLGECANRLNDLEGRGLLSVPPTEIMLDYLHMLNNRLGVSLPDELYLACLLAKGFQATEKRS